jgi:hypothetical protein
MVTVTARFYVANVAHPAHDPEAANIKLQPAYNNGDGNQAWSKATPSGSIELYITNPSAVEVFRQAQRDRADLHITFQRVDELE